MKLLLDTQISIWLALEPHKLTSNVLSILGDPTNVRFLSIASTWEMQIKFSTGKLTLPEPPQQFVPVQRNFGKLQTLLIVEKHIW